MLLIIIIAQVYIYEYVDYFFLDKWKQKTFYVLELKCFEKNFDSTWFRTTPTINQYVPYTYILV